jgi:hypothetical protein
MVSLLAFFCSFASCRLLPFEALDGDHGQVPVVKRSQDAVQRALIGKSSDQDTFCSPAKAGEVSDLHPRNSISPSRVHASTHTDSVDCRAPHGRLIVLLITGHRSNPMDQTLPAPPGNRVSRNGPKTAHSCQSRIGRLQSGLCGRRGSEEAQV